MKIFNKKRTATGLLFFILGLFFLYQSSQFQYSFPPEPGTLHSMAFPKVLLSCWCVLSILYILVPRETFHIEDLKKVAPKISALVLSIVLFIILVQTFGFIPAGIVLLLTVFWILEYRDLKRAVPLAVISVLVMYAAFTYGMSMPLPEFSL